MINIKQEDLLEKPKKTKQPITKYNKEAYVIPLHVIKFPDRLLNNNDRADMFTDMISVIFKKAENHVSLVFMPQELLSKGQILVIDVVLSKTAINKLKARIAKQKQVKLHMHYLYALALMWWYADWADTSEYETCIKQLKLLSLPKQFVRVHKLPLYRSLTISPEGRKKLAQGKSIRLKPRLGTSWSIGKRRPLFVARYYKQKQLEEARQQAVEENKPISTVMRLPQPKIITLTLNKPTTTIINAYKLRLCDEFKIFASLVTKHYKSLYRYLLDEVILKGNGGFSKIRLRHVT